MQRSIIEHLKNWKDDPSRSPLMVRGARQVGKSYAIEQFAKSNFENSITVNLELHPELTSLFDTLDPHNICNALGLRFGHSIEPGKSLLFLDEIQENPKAIQALRYFKEKYPELHVIAAGSLLEFAIKNEDFRMPVGRLQSFYMNPLSFKEFLIASGNEALATHLTNVTVSQGLEPTLHNHLLDLLRNYLIIGGMPACVDEFIKTNNLLRCQSIQANILNDYREDFGKYASQAKHKYLQRIYEHAPGLVAQHFKYVDIDPDMQSRDLKDAMDCLQDAGLVKKVYSTKASGLPLNNQINWKKYKLLFLDVGLVQYSSKLAADILSTKEDILTLNRGQIAEQFVGQELLNLKQIYERGELYYWDSETRGQTAEVDFVINIDANIVPIEVKAGSTGTLKSLKRFMEQKKCHTGVRISQKPLSLENGILSIPLYMINELPRLYREL